MSIEWGPGRVISVFGRGGAVTAVSGDYSAAQVTNAADTTAVNTFANASPQVFSGGITCDGVLSFGSGAYIGGTVGFGEYGNDIINAGGLNRPFGGTILMAQQVQVQGAVTINSGTGVPTIAGALGDWFIRTDTPTVADQRLYICTAAGAAGAATWTGVV